MAVLKGRDLNREAREANQEAAAVVAHVEHSVGERAGLGVGELELPGVYGDLYRPVGGCGARQLAPAAESHGRPRRGGCGGPLEDVGAGERGDHRVGWLAQKLRRGGELNQPAVLDHPDALGSVSYT